MLQARFSLERSLLSNDLRDEILLKNELKLHSICIPLFHPRAPDSLITNQDPCTKSDQVVSSHQDWSHFICRMSYWIDLDTENRNLKSISVSRFDQELSYASHLGIKMIILPAPKCFSSVSSYCFHLSKYLASSLNIQYNQQRLFIPLPLISPNSYQFRRMTGNTNNYNDDQVYDYNESNEESWNNWYLWNEIRSSLNYSVPISLALEITPEFEDFVKYYFEKNMDFLNFYLRKWSIEPVKILIISSSSLLTNSHGFPVLSKSLQYVIKFFLKLSVQIQLRGKSRYNNNHPQQSKISPPGLASENPSVSGTSQNDHHNYENGSYLPYFHYFRFLVKKAEDELFPNSDTSQSEKFSSAYTDVLQLPLQPLMDNLESYTYETFEKDPTKYLQYEKAIGKALLHFHHQHQRNDMILSNGTSSVTPVKVMVVGAGRGPLISATLSASNQFEVPVKIYVIEKNPNAIITLRNKMKQEYWDTNQIEIISKDMRNYHCPEKCDLIVSELLGSFGDNELSPECLYNTEHNLHEKSVSIPTSYTSFLQPISSPFLYTSAREIFSQNLSGNSPSNAIHVPSIQSMKGLETPYVVLMKKFFPFDEPQPCWSFYHPSWKDESFSSEAGGDELSPEMRRYYFANFFPCPLTSYDNNVENAD